MALMLVAALGPASCQEYAASADGEDGLELGEDQEVDGAPDEALVDGDDRATFEDGEEDHPDGDGCSLGGDVEWDGCEEIGDHCLPTDTSIFMGWCYDEPADTYHFLPDASMGYCRCGFPRFDGVIEGVLCDPGNPVVRSAYPSGMCESDQRVLCAIDFLPASRVGCCDAEGYAYCERDPLPCSNRCVE